MVTAGRRELVLVLVWAGWMVAAATGLIHNDFRLSGAPTSPAAANISLLEAAGPLSQPTGSGRGSSGARSRTRRQTLSIPPGAVVGIIPKFGWLLYEGSDNEELDFVVETEFLYRFPHSTETEVGETRHTEVDHRHRYDTGFDHDGWLAVHRQKRMVRDKQVVYKGLAGIFSRLGLEGKACLLKTICEITGSPLLHDGLVGELLNMALIPSHTMDGAPDELEEYRQAEQLGSSGHSCQAAFSQCPISLFKQLST